MNINLVHNKEDASIENYENVLTTEINKIAPNICTNIAIHNTLNYLTNDGKTRFNPNLYRNGKVCISLLNTWKGEQWTSCQTIESILLSLVES